MLENLIIVSSFDELYNWFLINHYNCSYVWVNAKRGKPNNKDFNYLDAVYCALCFGWIDSTCKNIGGVTYQKLMPRSKKSHWTYLNIARCHYLINKGLMRSEGEKLIPKDYDPLKENPEILLELKKDRNVWNNFNNFPDLYKRVRIDNIVWSKNDDNLFKKRLNKLILSSLENKMYGEWNDYDLLID